MSWNSWTRQQVELLIEEYKEHPILYSLKNKYYHNRKLRSVALNEILKKVKTIRPDTQVTDVLKKINGLRTNYVSERKKQLNSTKDLTSDVEIYQPSLWYYDLLTFLNSNITPRDRERDLEELKKPESKTKLEGQGDDSLDELAFQDGSSGFRSLSTDPLSEAEIESKFSYDVASFEGPPLKKKKEINIDVVENEKIDFSQDPDDNGWLNYLSTLLGQIKDPQNKVLLRHKVTKLMYEEIEKQF